jgi:hypothetical protein
MSADRDVTRIVRSWLEEGVTALPDRVLDGVLDQLPSTPQRRSWWPVRRFRDMNTVARLAIAAAAVVAVAVVGINLLPSGGVGVQRPNPTPAPTATPSPSPLPSSGSLDAGSYYIDEGGPASPERIAFAVPAGWAAEDGFVYKDRGAVAPSFAPGSGPGDVTFTTWAVSHVYADACQWQGSLVDAGTTVDQLANVLVAQKGRVASAATDVTLGGVPAKRIELTNAASLDPSSCNSSVLRFWPDPGPDESGGLCCTVAGSTDVVYVVALAGNRFTVVVRHQADSSAADVAELEAVVATIRIETSAASSAPASSSPAP